MKPTPARLMPPSTIPSTTAIGAQIASDASP
jgi:hypothetical protein